jgi:hypothetical protein
MLAQSSSSGMPLLTMSDKSLQDTFTSDMLIIRVVSKNSLDKFAHFSWHIVGYSLFINFCYSLFINF